MPRLAFPLVYRLMRPRMVKRLRLGPGAADESEAEPFEVLDTIDEPLRRGDYLVGDGFWRADLTGAALLGLMTWPPEHDVEFPPTDMLPRPLATFLDAIRSRPSFAWSLRICPEHRRPAAAR